MKSLFAILITPSTDAKIEGKLLKKPTNYRPLPDYLREHVDLYGAESALKTFVKFEATAKKLGFGSIEATSVKIQHEICDAYGLPYPTDPIG